MIIRIQYCKQSGETPLRRGRWHQAQLWAGKWPQCKDDTVINLRSRCGTVMVATQRVLSVGWRWGEVRCLSGVTWDLAIRQLTPRAQNKELHSPILDARQDAGWWRGEGGLLCWLTIAQLLLMRQRRDVIKWSPAPVPGARDGTVFQNKMIPGISLIRKQSRWGNFYCTQQHQQDSHRCGRRILQSVFIPSHQWTRFCRT